MIIYIALQNLKLHFRRHFMTTLGIITGVTGMILFGGYVLRMDDYLSTHTIFLRHTGHISLYKQEAIGKFHQNPLKYSFTKEEFTNIQNYLLEETPDVDKLDIVKIIATTQTQSLVNSGCQNFPVRIQGIQPEDIEWIYTHPEVLKNLPELVNFASGEGFWKNFAMHPLGANITPVLWSFFNKDDFSSTISSDEPNDNSSWNCQTESTQKKIKASRDVQLLTQDFYGGLGIADSTIVGLKYSGFSIWDEIYFLTSNKQVENLVKSDNIYKISIYFKNKKNLHSKLMRVKEILQKKDIKNFEIFPFDDANVSEVYVGSMNFVWIMFGFFIVLICGVVILTIFNSLQIAFLERKKDISVYKSIGFKNRIITQIFQIEYLVVSFVGCAISLVLGKALTFLNNSLNFRFLLPGYSSTLQFILSPTLSFSLVIVICTLAVVQCVCIFQLNKMLSKQSIELMRLDS